MKQKAYFFRPNTWFTFARYYGTKEEFRKELMEFWRQYVDLNEILEFDSREELDNYRMVLDKLKK